MEAVYRLVRPARQEKEGEDLALRGLKVLMGGPERADGTARGGAEERERIERFLKYARSTGLETRGQVLAFEKTAEGRERVGGMCLWVPARGRSAMLFAPPLSEFPEAAGATQAAIAGALEDARAAGIGIAQAILEPADAAGKTVFAAAGMVRLATLAYMERKPPGSAPAAAEMELPPEYRVEGYREETHGMFREAIERSYEGTLDCPMLAGMRDMEDTIEGHKGVGVFDPGLWSVVLSGERAAGCLLLSEIPQRNGLELVYLGLAPEARGKGIGKRLVKRALAAAVRRHFDVATLAVDAANVAAVRLYKRCGYSKVAERAAMVARL
jgi:mycothiol synthase